jgi:hypothetical protein
MIWTKSEESFPMNGRLQTIINQVAEVEERATRIPADAQRELILYPALLFKDQLGRLETLAEQRGEAVAALIRSAVDDYLFRKMLE